MPIFGLLRTVVLTFIGLTQNGQRPLVCLERGMLSVERFPSASSVNGYVLVAFFKGLAVFRDFNGLRIEDAN
jgi:hypothetical protein